MSSARASTVHSRVNQASREAWEDIHDLVIEHCDVMVAAMDALVDFVKDVRTEKAKRAWGAEKRGNEIQMHNLHMLNSIPAVSTPDAHFYRTIVILDMLINDASKTGREIDWLEVEPDRFMLQIAVELNMGTRSLRDGFRQLRKNRAAAVKHARAAQKAEREVERIYRRAEAKLFEPDDMLERLIPGKPYSKAKEQAMQTVLEMMRRREVFRILSKGADHLAWAAAQLRELIAADPPILGIEVRTL